MGKSNSAFLTIMAVGLVAIILGLTLTKGDTELNSHHPFRSEDAKQTYLAYYDERASAWPVVAETKMIPTSLGQTHVRISGPSTGHPLVLLPGDSETSLSWAPQIAALSAEYRTYAIDSINDFGRSVNTRPVRKPADFVQWLDELFMALDLDEINLVAFSYGGWQASLYALSHPARLNKLVLLAPAATVLPPGLELLARGILQYFLPSRPIVQRYLYWYHPDAVQRGAETRAEIDDLVDELLLSTKCFKRRKFVPPTVLTDAEWNGLQIPALFIVGENDVTYSAQKAIERLNAVAGHVNTVLIPDAGHDLRSVETERVNREVLEFLSVP